MILEEILDTLSDAPLEQVRIGPFWTAVVALRKGQRCCGLSSTLLETHENHHARPPVRWAGQLSEHSAPELARLAPAAQGVGQGSLLEASIGVAAINALLGVDENRCREENALHVLQRRGAGKRVALVGHFPFVDRLRSAVGELEVLELRPRPGDLPAERATEVVPRSDVVAITGTALINGTMESLLALCRPDAYVIVLGPSTPLSPVLFRHGVTALAGTLVADVDEALQCVSQGSTFRQMRGVRTVVMAR